jgi:hypothetical protein
MTPKKKPEKRLDPFVGSGAHTRNKRIDQAEWERHKSNIIPSYLAHGLRKTREWMEEQHGFIAT